MSVRTWLKARSEREWVRREAEQARTKGSVDDENEALWRLLDARAEANQALLKKVANLAGENARLRMQRDELREHLAHLLDVRDGAR